MTKSALILFLFTSAASAAPAPERIDEIRAVVEKLQNAPIFDFVDVKVNDELPMPAAASQVDPSRFLIQYSGKIFSDLSWAAKDFILFHELGHIRLGHVSRPYPGEEGAREFELEADVFAVFLYKQLRSESLNELRDFLTFLRARTWTIPSGPERADLCESLL